MRRSPFSVIPLDQPVEVTSAQRLASPESTTGPITCTDM